MVYFPPPLRPRQNPTVVDDDDLVYDGGFWYNNTAYIIKWSIVGGIFLLSILFAVAAYFHAQARMKKGLRPLGYHRWMVPRRQRMQFEPAYQNQYTAYPINNRGQDGYAMDGYAPPPPVYNRNSENAPNYMPPDGASKINPDQGDYAAVPPPGAPPARNDDAPAYPAPVAGNSERERL